MSTITITQDQFDTYEPFEGGIGSTLLEKDGFYEVKLMKLQETESRAGNTSIKISMNVLDSDAEGGFLVKTVPVTGKRKDGKDNIHGLFEFLRSIYSAQDLSKEEIDQKLRSLVGNDLDLTGLCTKLTGQRAYVEVVARIGDRGGFFSEVKNFVLKSKVEDARASNAHRRPLSMEILSAIQNPDGSTMPNSSGAATGLSAAAADVV